MHKDVHMIFLYNRLNEMFNLLSALEDILRKVTASTFDATKPN